MIKIILYFLLASIASYFIFYFLLKRKSHQVKGKKNDFGDKLPEVVATAEKMRNAPYDIRNKFSLDPSAMVHSHNSFRIGKKPMTVERVKFFIDED